MSAADPIGAFLRRQPRLVLDGALATELERCGADLSDALWSARLLIEQPALIREVHLDYFRAGADVATTASYQASFEGFARRGLSHDEAAALMRLSVQLADEARRLALAERAPEDSRPAPLVAASIGPYGAMLADGSEYRGGYALDEAALMAFHRPRLQLLATSGADLLACETLPCLAEARALARLMDEQPGCHGWISFSCRDAEHNSQGERLADCVAALEQHASVVAIGINCTAPQHVAPLLLQARAQTRKPLLVYPNAGEVWDAQARRWLPGEACGHRPFDEQALAWAAAGARLIGGCCRTGPADIAALARRWR